MKVCSLSLSLSPWNSPLGLHSLGSPLPSGCEGSRVALTIEKVGEATFAPSRIIHEFFSLCVLAARGTPHVENMPQREKESKSSAITIFQVYKK